MTDQTETSIQSFFFTVGVEYRLRPGSPMTTLSAASRSEPCGSRSSITP